ncbi:MAG: DUF1127 domain-containing protein, partial [Pseudomonadota bacterium]
MIKWRNIHFHYLTRRTIFINVGDADRQRIRNSNAMENIMATLARFAGPLHRPRRGTVLHRIVSALIAADAAYRAKRELAALSEAQLKDVGLSEAERDRALNWTAPAA